MTVAFACLSPAHAGKSNGGRTAVSTPRGGIGSFTPAASDARLAAALSRSGLSGSGFRFTPASSVRLNRSVTIAVRARGNRVGVTNERVALVAQPVPSLAPVAYNLGLAIGWWKFALSGDVAKVDIAGLGRQEAVDVGVSFTEKRLSTRLQLGADRSVGAQQRLTDRGPAYSVDLGTSYSLTRNVDVTAGVRYRTERDRLVPQSDTRRDSQAVYLGTAFRF